jgi:hypothetical protein
MITTGTNSAQTLTVVIIHHPVVSVLTLLVPVAIIHHPVVSALTLLVPELRGLIVLKH